jgi:hypothetical protein
MCLICAACEFRQYDPQSIFGNAMNEKRTAQHLCSPSVGSREPITTPRSNQPWARDEDERLRALMEAGKTARAISMDFRRTTRAIRRRAERLKLSWRKAKVQMREG